MRSRMTGKSIVRPWARSRNASSTAGIASRSDISPSTSDRESSRNGCGTLTILSRFSPSRFSLTYTRKHQILLRITGVISVKKIFSVLLFAALAQETVHAANTGALKGYVKHPTGAIVPGAALTLLSVDTGATAKVSADDNGFFQFLQLAPGRYELTATASGFRRADVKDILVLLDQIVSYDVRLEVGQVT